MKLLGGHVAVAAVEQKARQGEALTRRSKARAAQTVERRAKRSIAHRHGLQYGQPRGGNKA
jgi:hypothetical protein